VSQRRLYQLNRSVPDAAGYAERIAIEQDWVVARAARFEAAAPSFRSRRELLAALDELLGAEEKAYPSQLERFLAEEATLAEFRSVVAEFAVDGLVESHSHLAILPRLPGRARRQVFRVIVDELGGGNEELEHARLYERLAIELGLPTAVEAYMDVAGPECFAYVNLFHWLAARAPAPEYFLGAYAYFESSVLYGYRCYAAATERLGIAERGYYLEHLYIDSFHNKQMRAAIRALEEDRPLDLAKAWAGIQLTSEIVAEATAAAIGRARDHG